MEICKVEGCEEKHKAKGYCNRHYKQMVKNNRISKRTKYDPNEIIIKDNIAEIVLYNTDCKEKARATIDAEDVGRISGYKWCLASDGYVRTDCGSVAIQNIIMHFTPNGKQVVDHRNRRPLKNQKSNLRLCTRFENAMNSRGRTNNSSGYRGVSWDKRKKQWRAVITANGKNFHLGYYKFKEQAAVAYSEAAIKYHGEFACFN